MIRDDAKREDWHLLLGNLTADLETIADSRKGRAWRALSA